MTIHKTQKNDNEIDLLWLLQSFWKEKVFITAIAVFFTIISGVYFLLVSPSIDERKVEPSKHRIEKIVSGKKINIPFDSGNIERSSKPSLVLTISFFTGFIFAIVLLLIRNLLRNREART